MPKPLRLTSKSQCLKIISQLHYNQLNKIKEREYLAKEAKQNYRKARLLFQKHLLTLLSPSITLAEEKNSRTNLSKEDLFHKDSRNKFNKSEYVHFNSILGPSCEKITEKSLQAEQLMRNRIETDIIKRENEYQSVRFHYDQYLIETIKSGDQQTKQSIATFKPKNEKLIFRWNKFPNSKLMNMIPLDHKLNESISNTVGVNEDPIEFIVNNGSLHKINRPKTLSTKKGKSVYSSSSSSRRPKSSLSGVSSLDEQELDLINQQIEKLNQLVFERLQIVNQEETSECKNLNMTDNLERGDSYSVIENQEDTSSEQINLPSYVTYSVKKSHQYAVNNWLNSNYCHIG